MNKHLTKVQVLLLGAALATAILVLASTSWAQPEGVPPDPGLGNMDPAGPPPGGPGGMGMMPGRGGPGQWMMPRAGGLGRHGDAPGLHQGPMQGGAPGVPCGPGGGLECGRMPDLWNHPEVQKKLNLTEEQVKALQARRLELETQRIKVQAEMEIARLKLEDLIEQDDVNKEAIDAQIEELGKLHADQIRGMVYQKLALREVLNEEQLKKVDDFIARMKSRDFLEGKRDPDDRGMQFPNKERAVRGRDREERGPEAKDRGHLRGEKKQRPGGPMRFGPPKDLSEPSSENVGDGSASEEGGSESSK